MAESTVTLRLTATADGVVTGVRIASHEVKSLGGAAQQAGTQAAAGFGKARAGVESISQQLAAAKTQMLAFLGAAQFVQVLRGIARMADEWSEVGSRLSLATKGAVAQAAAMDAVFRVAQRTSTAVDTTGNLVARLSANLTGMGQSAQAAFSGALALAETINKTFALSGASAAAQANAITQFTQSLAGGILRAEEFNSVIENSPRLAQAIADGMGKSMGELRKAVNDGVVSASGMLRAIQSQSGVIAAEFEKLPLTIGRAWTQLQNGVLQYVGTTDQGIGASAQLAQSIQLVAQNLNVLVAAVVAFAKVAVALYVGSAIQQGVVALGTAVALARVELATFNVGLAAGAVASGRMGVGMAAATVATRGLAGAVALIEANPIMLVVTAVALLANKLMGARAESKQMTESLRAGVEASKRALDEFNRTPALGAAGQLGETSKKLRDISAELDKLRQKQRDLEPASGISKLNVMSWLTYKVMIGDTTEQIKAHERALREMGPAYSQAVSNTAALLQQMIGVKDVSPETRAGLARLATEIAEGRDVSLYAATELAHMAQEEGNAAAAAWLLRNGLEGAKSSIADVSELSKAAAARLASMRVQLAELRGGKVAGIRERYGQDIIAKGGAEKIGPEGMAELGRAMLAEIAAAKEIDVAQKANAASRKANSDTIKAQEEATKRATESQARYTKQAALEAAELRGPLAAAQAQNTQKLAELDAAYSKHNITLAAYTTLKQVEAEKLAKATAEVARNMAAPQALLDTMTGELRLLQQVGPERELARRRMQAQADMHRALADAVEAAGGREQLAAKNGAKSWADYEAAMLGAADGNAKLSMQIEEHAAQAEEWAGLWKTAVSSVADAFTEFVMSGLRGFKNFGKSLKNIAKQLVSDLIRTFLQQKIIIPIQAQITQMFSGGGGLFGSGGQGGLSGLFGGLGDKIVSGFSALFGRGGSATTAIAEGTGTAMDGWFNQLKQSGGLMGTMLYPVQAGGSAMGGAMGGLGSILGPLLGIGIGAGMGGDTLGKIGGGLAGGAIAYSMLMSGGGLAGWAAGSAAGGLFGGASGMLGAMGPVGWAGLAAMAINSLTGGKLFGTSYKPESGAQQFDIGPAGATGYNSITEVKQRSFFRGRSWRTTTSPLDSDAQAAINQLFETLQKTVQTAAAQLGIDVPAIVGGTFRREFDKNGNLTREFGTIAGKVYNEAQEAFAARLVGENMLAVAKAAGSAAELEQLADAYRGTGEQLQAFATAALAIQEDLLKANGIWAQVDGDGVMTRIVHYIEGMAKAGESLADAYARIQKAITDYGTLIGGARQYIATHDLNQYQKSQLEVELQYRDMVKQANELAKALGLSGARSEDLATLEQWRALQMGDLAKQYAAQQAQNTQWLQDLSLSNLSPLTDQQKLDQAMQLMQQAAGAGDMARAQKLAEQVLGLGRNLYASGQDYNDLYAQVTQLVGDMSTQSMEELQGLTNDELANLANLVSGLPAQIAQALADILIAPPVVQGTPAPAPAPLPPAPTPTPPSGGGGGGGYDSPDRCVAAAMLMDDGTPAALADAGNVHITHDPAEGFRRRAIVARGAAVMQPCVRIVTQLGIALVCSRSTPFTHVDAPADLPEYTLNAPDMQGRMVRVRYRGEVLLDIVADVQDAGDQLVVPLDFGGRSFAAGEVADALIYSHNMQKAPSIMVGEPDPYGAQMVALLSDIADSNASMNRRDASGSLDALNSGTRVAVY